MAQLGGTQVYGDLEVTGKIVSQGMPMITGSLRNTTGSGIANNFYPLYQNILTFSGDRIIIPKTGNYYICINAITNKDATRYDTTILINGSIKAIGMNDSVTGHHSRSLAIVKYLKVNDYIQFNHPSWYDATNIGHSVWTTASVAFLG